MHVVVVGASCNHGVPLAPKLQRAWAKPKRCLGADKTFGPKYELLLCRRSAGHPLYAARPEPAAREGACSAWRMRITTPPVSPSTIAVDAALITAPDDDSWKAVPSGCYISTADGCCQLVAGLRRSVRLSSTAMLGWGKDSNIDLARAQPITPPPGDGQLTNPPNPPNPPNPETRSQIPE